MPLVRVVTTVEVWTDRESYYADMVASVGRRYDGSTGYIVGPTNVTILVTSDPPAPPVMSWSTA